MVATPAEGDETAVEWRRGAADAVTPPIVRQVPYLELKLEHPGLEPTAYGDQFFPDAVPYELYGRKLVFYWRPALSASSTPSDDWQVACATTRNLAGVGSLPWTEPALTTRGATGVTVVVDGTVGGDATTAHLRSYSPPSISLDDVSETRVALSVDGHSDTVSVGERQRIPLDEQTVEPVGADGEPTAVTPELAVRYPGRREIHHPARGTTSRVFPSFGLDLDDVPNPLPVPTSGGELDDEALATALGVDLSTRPYPERVLWQAFAYVAFDPHAETVSAIAQLKTEHIVLKDGIL
jgi:hypothetical protein